MRQWHLDHKEEEVIYRQEHRPALNKNARTYNGKNRKGRNQLLKNWRRKNPKRVKLHGQRRLALVKGGGEISIDLIQRVYEDNIKKYGTLTCYICEKSIQFNNDSLEHKIPLSKGGTNLYENLAIAHISCNSKKGVKVND